MTRLKPGKLSKKARILIPELLNLILAHLDHSDYAKFVSISQRWFHCVAPLLWQNVTGLTKLFSLIPNTKITVKRNIGGDAAERVVLIDIPRRADFSRFEFYVKFVKALDVRDIYKLDGKKRVSAYCSPRSHSLLPKLASLTCRYKHSPAPLTMLDWIGWFLGASLLKLSVMRDGPSFWGPSNTKDRFAFSLLELVASKCFSLQQVEIPSCSSMTTQEYDVKVSKISLVPQLSLLLPTLRVISGTESLLEPQNLEALSQLPCLETLKIDAQYGERPSIASGEMQWPKHCFLSIRHLHLASVRIETLRSLWNFEALVHSLVTLDIETSTQGRSTTSCVASRNYLLDFIRELSSRSPHLTDLDCRLHTCHFFCKTCVPARLSFPELESLEALSLQRLSLQGVWLAENVSHSHLVRSIPHVRTFQLLDVPITLKDLHHYVTHLLRLEYLRCVLPAPRLERKRTPVEELAIERISTAHRVITFDLKLSQLALSEHPLHEEQAVFLARYLYQLCPRARCLSTDSEFEPICRRINKLFLRYQ